MGDLDIWSFTASEGDYIAVSMGEDTPASSSFEPWIRLVSPTGALVGNSIGPAAAQIAVTALTSGTYTVIVGTKTFYNIIDGTGSYRLTLTKGPGAFAISPGDDGGALTNGATHTGSIYVGDLDIWSFTASEGDYIAVSMGEDTPASSSFEPWIRLVSPTGALVGNSIGPAAAQIGVTALTSGTYTVIVGTKTFYNVIDGTGSYRLTLTKGPGAFELSPGDEGGTLTNGATHAGAIYVGDLDIWSFTATQGDYIAVSMGEDTPASTSFEPWIRLVSPTGALLGNSIGPSAAQVAVTAPASGTYTVIVGTKTFYNVIDGTGSYRLTLAKGPGAFVTSAGDEGGPMTNGIDYTGFIHLGDLDMWSFTTIQGQAITLNITEVAPASSSFEPWIRLVSPTGVLLGDRAGAAAAQIAVTAPVSGTYTVIVGTKTFYNVIDGTGNYVLRVGGASSVDYTLALEPVALTIVQGTTGSATVTITRTNFTGAVTLNLGNAPIGVTGSFNPSAPTGTSSTLTVSVGAAVAPGIYNLTVDGTATAGNRSTPLTLTVTTGIVRLTTSPGFDGEPDWSPDGTKIVFQSERDGGDDEIYVMNADGTGAVRLTTNAGLDVTPVWSPDGTKIAFRSTRDGNSEIYVMNTDGTGVLRLTNNAARDWQPAWSPDGARIAFASRRDGDDEIYVMNADGTGVVRLTTSAGDDNQPAWSPDGAKIAFVSTRDGDDEIYVMNADGTGVVRLTTSPGFDSRPAWSPDGAKIAFDSPREGGHFAIYVMNTDGSGVTRLTTGTADDFAPAWSPDGAKIAFASTRDDPAGDIYVMHVF